MQKKKPRAIGAFVLQATPAIHLMQNYFFLLALVAVSAAFMTVSVAV